MGKEYRWLPGAKRRRAHLITDAPITAAQQRHHRERVYSILQGIRIPFLFASAATYLWWHNAWLSIIFFLISIPLPWVSVVIANGHGTPRDKKKQAVYKPAALREMYEYDHALDQRQLRSESAGRSALPMAPSAGEIVEHDDSDNEVVDSDHRPH